MMTRLSLRRSLLAGLLALAVSAPAHATMVSVREASCPLGGSMVKIYDKVAANAYGGYDSDLATYSTKGQFREFAVSTCSDNLFSLYGDDMESTIDEETAAKLTVALAEEVTRLSDAEDPPVWERYGIAARMYQELGRDPFFVAQVYVEASWTARDAAVGVYQGLEGPHHAQILLRDGAAELDKDLTLEQRKTVLYNLARVAHRGGYAQLRDSYLDKFEAAGSLTDDERSALDNFRHIARDIEPMFQDKAIALFRAGLDRPGVAIPDKINATYMLADLLRRRGKDDEAMALFTLVLSEEEAPMNLREMALVLARELAGEEPIEMDQPVPQQ